MRQQTNLKKIVIANMELFYEEYGNGTNYILLLHGWGQSHAFWNNLIETLSGKYHIFVLDLPGFGLSKEPPTNWTLDDYAKFIKAFVTKIAIKNPIIIGHSFGGRIASVYASQFPVKKLILYSNGGLPIISLKFEINKRIVVPIGKYLLPNLLYKSHTLMFKPKQYENRIVINTERSRRMLDIYTRPSENLKKIFEKIKVKTLIITGEKDYIARPIIGRTIHRLIKNSHLVEVPKATHFAHIESSKIFNKTLLEFLAEN